MDAGGERNLRIEVLFSNILFLSNVLWDTGSEKTLRLLFICRAKREVFC